MKYRFEDEIVKKMEELGINPEDPDAVNKYYKMAEERQKKRYEEETKGAHFICASEFFEKYLIGNGNEFLLIKDNEGENND